jgi:hypothetical protein
MRPEPRCASAEDVSRNYISASLRDGTMMDELLKSRQVVVGLLIFVAGAIWLLLPELGMMDAASGTNMIALVMAMLGAMIVFLGVSVTGGGAENVEGMGEIFEMKQSLDEMRMQIELLGTLDNKSDDDD